METRGPEDEICQSCGMPLQRDEDFGTNADGSRSGEYCQYCYKDGAYTNPNLTLEQQIERLVGMSVSQMNIPEEQARTWANEVLPNLKRWKN